jgi:hypothetical protein
MRNRGLCYGFDNRSCMLLRRFQDRYRITTLMLAERLARHLLYPDCDQNNQNKLTTVLKSGKGEGP